jgi:putative FmdB family regulatory protein
MVRGDRCNLSPFSGGLMPIYAYRCSSCGFQKDHLQKMSDPLLTDCPECGKPAYQKMLTAAGFQLKGSGWYATDFKGGSTGVPAPAMGSAASATADKGGDSASKDSSSKDGGSKDSGSSAPAAAPATGS